VGQSNLPRVLFKVPSYIGAHDSYLRLCYLELGVALGLLFIEIFYFLVDLDSSLKRHLEVQDHQVDRPECGPVLFESLCKPNFEYLLSSVDRLLPINGQCSLIQYALVHQVLLYE
jgi:hypothetical protein